MQAYEGTTLDLTGRELHRFCAAAALALSVLAIWALTHEYRGLVYDGQIYAVQALAKLKPALNADLFLQNTTQDGFTIFPCVYAWVISCIGLNAAALLLTALFSVWFLYAAWNLTAVLFNRDDAWLAIFLIVISGGHYGAFGVFHFLEPYLTARLAAEALVVTALACYLHGFQRVGLRLSIGALFVHPLAALPGLLLLICMRLPLRAAFTAAAIGVLMCLGVGIAAGRVPAVGHLLPIMDAPWLDVVRERSQFLFLQLWATRDWELNVRPFVCLALTMMMLPDAGIRKLAASAMLVGVAGLSIAGIASLVPVALLMQGQAWRWMWITTFVSVVFVLPTARHLWNGGKWGRGCALLLVAGWSFPADVGCVYASLSLLLWMLRGQRWLQSDQLHRWAIAAIVVSILAWGVADTWTAIASLSARSNTHSGVLTDPKVSAAPPVSAVPLVSAAPPGSAIPLVSAVPLVSAAPPVSAVPLVSIVSISRAIFGLKVWCVLLAASAWHGIGKSRSCTLPILTSCALATVSAVLLYEPFNHSKSFGSASDMNEFADWRRAIPPASTVFVTNGHDSGSFVWFTLERNNYLSPGQSAGVVFSRATALEVRRRSDVLLPLVDPNWKMLTSLRQAASDAPGEASFKHYSLKHYPITSTSLASVCSDSNLGFVISPDDVGFHPLRHAPEGAYRNWNLYDCNRVRVRAPAS